MQAAAAAANFEAVSQRRPEGGDDSQSPPPPLLASLLDNPWVDKSPSSSSFHSDAVATALESQTGEVAGCAFRNSANASFYGRSEFVDEYVAYKRCRRRFAAAFDAWAASKISASVGAREELVVRTNFEFEGGAAAKCKSAPKPLFVFAVTSGAGNLRRRKAIRRTWGKGVERGGDSLLLFFLSGGGGDGDDRGAEAVAEEAARYGDVVRCKGLGATDGAAAAELEARMATAVLAWTYRRVPRLCDAKAGATNE